MPRAYGLRARAVRARPEQASSSECVTDSVAAIMEVAQSPGLLGAERVGDVIQARESSMPLGTLLQLRGRKAADKPMFHALIRRFGELTGVPVLPNTSFNRNREPMVCIAQDAIRIFYRAVLTSCSSDRSPQACLNRLVK